METWVLVLLVSAYNGNNISHVPGYKSVGDCEAAAKVYVEKGATFGYLASRTQAFCIPGPK